MERALARHSDVAPQTLSTPHVPEEWALAREAGVNLLLTRMPPLNPLLRGVEGVIRNVLERVLPDLREPVVAWAPGSTLLLPSPVQAKTLILHEVGGMAVADQRRVLDWLEAGAGDTQVVSTSWSPLLGQVTDGGFDERLYYRLNTVCLEVTPDSQ